MKIVHLADTHLGAIGTGVQRYVEDPYGQNIRLRQQEADIRVSFATAIERTLTLGPAFVLHTGDLFDQAHPNPHSLDFAFRQLRRLSDAYIPVVLLEGDHSAPRSAAQGEALRLLTHLPGVEVACGVDPRRVEVAGVVIDAIPHRALLGDEPPAILQDAYEREANRFHILAAHGVADGWPFFQTWRNAAALRIRQVASKFDYVALGHCHRFSQVPGTDRAFYPGAGAMALTGDFRPGYTFGFNVVTLCAGKAPKVERELISTRPMKVYGLSDAQSCSAQEIMEFLSAQVKEVPPSDAYCRVLVEGIDPAVRSQLSLREIERLFPIPEVAGHTIQLRSRAMTQGERAGRAGYTPLQRFLELTIQSNLEEDVREEVVLLGTDFFSQAEAALSKEDQDSAG
ncbi:MAG: DNA repair exonuclease [Armatimonadota bacterium]